MIRPEKFSYNFPDGGIIIKSDTIIFDVCCDCGSRHATYIEVLRNKKRDEIFIQTLKDERGTEFIRKSKKYPVFKKRKK